MTAAAIIEHARADGVTLALDAAGKLKVRGIDAAVARWLPDVRQHKPALVLLLSGPGADRPAVEVAVDTAPAYRYLIRHPDGSLASHSFSPAATLAEVRAAHPGALSIEVEPNPVPEPAAASLEPDVPLGAPPVPGPVMVSCASCGHYAPNPRGFGGLGRCLIDAPASKRSESLWPRGEIHCTNHLGVTHDPE